MILEVDLYDFIAQSKHNRMPRPHPLLDVDGACGRFERIVSTVSFEFHLGVLV